VEVPALRFPGSCRRFGCRRWLLGSSCARWGIAPSSRSAYRQVDRRTPTGLSCCACASRDRAGRPLYPPLPRGRWCAPDRRLSSGRHPPLCCGQSLRPRWNIHRRGSPSRGVIRGSLAFAHHPGTVGCRPGAGKPHGFPPVFSSPATPGWNRSRLGFDPELRTPQLPATHVEAETGHRALTRVLHLQHQPNLHRCLPLALMHPHVARSRRWIPSPPG
jgi:hypothetical protein